MSATYGGEYAFDPLVVSHWPLWLGHKTPELLIIGQDFGNIEFFDSYCGRDGPSNRTNENLRTLLHAAGIRVGNPPSQDGTVRIYLANAILCMKVGKMNGPVKARWIDKCAQNHLLPLGTYLRPPFVIGMGSAGWRATRRIFELTAAVPKTIFAAAGLAWKGWAGVQVFASDIAAPSDVQTDPGINRSQIGSELVRPFASEIKRVVLSDGAGSAVLKSFLEPPTLVICRGGFAPYDLFFSGLGHLKAIADPVISDSSAHLIIRNTSCLSPRYWHVAAS